MKHQVQLEPSNHERPKQMTHTTITIWKEPTGYVVNFGGRMAYEVTSLFGTNTIPTGFTAQADENEVLAAIKECNPDCDVRLV